MSLVDDIRHAGFRGKLVYKEYITDCPFCQKRDKFYINVHTGFYICFKGSCSKRGHISHLIGKRYKNSEELFSEKFSLDFEDEDEVEYVKPPEDELKNFRKIHDYMIHRGFSNTFLVKNKIGYDKETHRVTIPIYMEGENGVGEYYGCIRRTVLKDVEPRYVYPKGLNKKTILYIPPVVKNILDSRASKDKYLFITEGSLDALRVASFGYLSASILGCVISKEQMEKIKRLCNEYDLIPVLMFDSDEAGQHGIDKAFEDYNSVDFMVFDFQTIYDSKQFDNVDDKCYNRVMVKDAADLTLEEFLEGSGKIKSRTDFILDELSNLSFY